MIFKCKMCGGSLNVKKDDTVCTCEYCGTKQTIPRLDDVRIANLYDRANYFRFNNEFDKAYIIYEQILSEDNSDCETYWSLVLCEYGIEYVEDPVSHKRVPTVNRTQFTSIFQNNNYKEAIGLANSSQKEVYEQEARQIDDIQKNILAISNNEDPFDIFICYKETDSRGGRTIDSVLAEDIYNKLTELNYKVFFARRTLEDKLGTEFEPYIFSALNSSKVMLVVGTSKENLNSVWVKNEWSRYLSLIKKNGEKKTLIPVYKGMDAYDLPDEFAILQAQSMDKVGAMQDLVNGIGKIIKPESTLDGIDEQTYEKFKKMLEKKVNDKYEVAVKTEVFTIPFALITFFLSFCMAFCMQRTIGVNDDLEFILVSKSIYIFHGTMRKLFVFIGASTLIAYVLGLISRKTAKISKYLYLLNILILLCGSIILYKYTFKPSLFYYAIIGLTLILLLIKPKWDVKEKIVYVNEDDKKKILNKNNAIVNNSVKNDGLLINKMFYAVGIILVVATLIFNFLPNKSQSNKRDSSLKQIEIITYYINIRSRKDATSGILGTVKKGEIYTYYTVDINSKYAWYQIVTSSGIKGYITGKYEDTKYVQLLEIDN